MQTSAVFLVASCDCHPHYFQWLQSLHGFKANAAQCIVAVLYYPRSSDNSSTDDNNIITRWIIAPCMLRIIWELILIKHPLCRSKYRFPLFTYRSQGTAYAFLVGKFKINALRIIPQHVLMRSSWVPGSVYITFYSNLMSVTSFIAEWQLEEISWKFIIHRVPYQNSQCFECEMCWIVESFEWNGTGTTFR